MRIRTLAARKSSRYCGLVKELPWSLFQISGVACTNACCTAASTKGTAA
jgi:hypothetical protein